MFKNLNDSIVLDQMINALLLMIVGTAFWSWLSAYGLPMNIWLGIGVFLLTADVADFSRDARPASILVGAGLIPFWPVIRFWVR